MQIVYGVQFHAALLLVMTDRSWPLDIWICDITDGGQVYGLQLGQSAYSVYNHWENTPDQRAEMLEYNGTAVFEQCDSEFIDAM